MAKLYAIKDEEESTADRPINLSDRAMDNLAFIRETMERSTHFTAVPGYGGILMGVTAIAAAYIASGQIYLRDWLIVWLAEAFLAASIGLLAMWQKSRLDSSSLLSVPAKKFVIGFLPPMLCGIAITLGLWRNDHYSVMPAVWMLLYGASVVNGGAFSVRPVPIMGWFFMAFGAAAFLVPTAYRDILMAASFGGLHLIFGAVIARRYGG